MNGQAFYITDMDDLSPHATAFLPNTKEYEGYNGYKDRGNYSDHYPVSTKCTFDKPVPRLGRPEPLPIIRLAHQPRSKSLRTSEDTATKVYITEIQVFAALSPEFGPYANDLPAPMSKLMLFSPEQHQPNTIMRLVPPSVAGYGEDKMPYIVVRILSSKLAFNAWRVNRVSPGNSEPAAPNRASDAKQSKDYFKSYHTLLVPQYTAQRYSQYSSQPEAPAPQPGDRHKKRAELGLY